MEQFKISARTREQSGTGPARKARREGQIPAVIYGHGKPVLNLLLPEAAVKALLRSGGNPILDLDVEGVDKVGDDAALIKEMHRHPVSREVLNVDLQWISLKEQVHVEVPVHLLGESPGVVKDGGSLDQILFDIPIVCLPTDIPEAIEVDISALQIGDTVHVGALTLPAGVTITLAPEDAVVSIARPIRAEDLETQLDEELPEFEAGAPAEGEEEAGAEEEAPAEAGEGAASSEGE